MPFVLNVLAFSGCDSTLPSSADASKPDKPKTSDMNNQVKIESTPSKEKPPASSKTKPPSEQTKRTQPDRVARDPYQLPSGGTRELLQFVEHLQSRQLEGKTVAERREAYRRTHQALVAAFDKLLRADIDPALRLHITNMKLNSLSDLMALGEPNAKEQFYAFARDALGQAQRVMLAAKEEPLRVSAIEMRMNALLVLSGQEDEPARQEFLQYVQEHSGDKSPHLARTAMRLLIDFHLRDVERGKRTDGKPIVETMKTYLSGGKGSDDGPQGLTAVDLATAVHRLGQLEQIGLIADARALHREALTAFTRNRNEELRAEAERQLAAVGTRLNLVGKPLAIEGRLSNGPPLGWKEYLGKVVLVDFWTSWERHSEQERVDQARARVAPDSAEKGDVPEIISTLDRLRRLYKQHHAEGLEIIGINLEKVQSDIDRFLDAQKLPWQNVTNLPGSARGAVEPNAARCGVESPPMAVLIDRFGRVVKVGVLNERFENRVKDALIQRPLKPR